MEVGRKRHSNRGECKGQLDRSRSIQDLPEEIFCEILLKLPVREICICRGVCKDWRKLILDHDFAKRHLKKAHPCPLVRVLDSQHVARMLYLIEPERCHNFDMGCDNDSCRGECGKHVKLELDTIFRIPVRNAEKLFDSECGDGVVERKYCIKVKPSDHKYNIVNSCNGFLCLFEPSCNDPVMVCNPVTGEYINLPIPTKTNMKPKGFVDCGLGFNPDTNQYKVIRIFKSWDLSSKRAAYKGKRAEILTLGTESWRNIGQAPHHLLQKMAFPTYFNGALLWITPRHIASFHLDKEKFQEIPLPLSYKNKFVRTYPSTYKICIGVLRGCLFFSVSSWNNTIDIWVMKEYGVRESWSHKYSITTSNGEWWPIGTYQPLNYLNDGALLMFHYFKSVLIYYDDRNLKCKCYKIHGNKSRFEAFAHTPSFISLKDALVESNAVVLNISRCPKLKFQGECRALTLVEEEKEQAADSYFSVGQMEQALVEQA